mmetsp:Transcript_25891/g.56254  ORF Transcript_25891/g.56254 Transcript_25891/m.56254 type:complete len:339 (-) Transcript_25891:66-1082(-)
MNRLRWSLTRSEFRVIPFDDDQGEATSLPRLHQRFGEGSKTLPAKGLAAAMADSGGDSPLPPETPITPSVSRKTTRFEITAKDLVQDADSTVQGTLSMLERSGALPHLCYSGEELARQLARPTPQLVHRVAVAIGEVSNFLASIPSDWPDDYETKLDLFWEIRIQVSFMLRLRPLDVVPLDILGCRKRDKTRWLIQLMCVAAIREQEASAAGEALSVQSDDSPMSSLMSRASSCYSVKSGSSIGSPTTAAARKRLKRVMSSYDLVTPRSEAEEGGFSPTLSISRWRSRGSLGSIGTPTSEFSPTWSAWSARTPAKSRSFFMTPNESISSVAHLGSAWP